MMPKLIPLKELFEPIYGVNLELIHLEECNKNDDESIRFVSRTENNNGVSAYVKKIIDIAPNPAHTISVAVSGSVLSSFYQDDEYYSGRDLYYLVPKIKMSKEEMIFYAFCIKANKYKYNYGRAANRTLRDIPIPAEMPADFRNISLNKIPIPSSQRLLNKDIELKINKWEYFTFDYLFRLFKGKRLTKAQMYEGKTPYISSSAFNNGVDAYISEEPNFKKPFLTFACYGSIGEVFYHPYDAWVSDNCNVMYLKNYNLNEYIAIFLISVIKKEKYRFSYGFTGKLQTLKKLKIKLPSKDGQPDWEFMESYIKSLPYSSSI